MNGEILRKLFESSNVEDVNLALEFISKYSFDEAAEILGEGLPRADNRIAHHNQVILPIHSSLQRDRKVMKQVMDYNIHFIRSHIKLCKRTGFNLKFPI